MGYLKIFAFLNFKTGSSQMISLQKCSSYFWEKGGQGYLPQGRGTVSRGWPQHWRWWGTALKGFEHNRAGLVTGSVANPNKANKEPQPRCFRGIKTIRRQGQRKTWRGSYSIDSSGVLLLKQFHFLFHYFKIWTIFLHAWKIGNNPENLNPACMTTGLSRHWKEECCLSVFIPPWKQS